MSESVYKEDILVQLKSEDALPRDIKIIEKSVGAIWRAVSRAIDEIETLRKALKKINPKDLQRIPICPHCGKLTGSVEDWNCNISDGYKGEFECPHCAEIYYLEAVVRYKTKKKLDLKN